MILPLPNQSSFQKPKKNQISVLLSIQNSTQHSQQYLPQLISSIVRRREFACVFLSSFLYYLMFSFFCMICVNEEPYLCLILSHKSILALEKKQSIQQIVLDQFKIWMFAKRNCSFLFISHFGAAIEEKF